ncbi:MAG: ABC transporter permease [Paracoccaceae bacterium]|nr:ABC transporter permease [Paracoccaceae bacterium]
MFHNTYVLTFLAVIKHWQIKPLQLFLMLLGLTTATALWNSVHLINGEAKKAYADAKIISSFSENKMLISKNEKDFDDKFFGELRKNGWPITPRIEGEIKDNKNGVGDIIRIIGIDPLSASNETITKIFQTDLSSDNFLRGYRVILAGPETAKKLSKLTKFKSVQVSNNLPEGYDLTDISVAQNILKKRKKLSSLHIVGQMPENLNAINSRGLKIHLNENNIDLDSLTKSFHLNLTAFGFLSYLVGLFIVYSTISLAFEQRKAILRALRSLGISSTTITGLMLFEILVISFVSGVLGVILSYFLASALLPDVAITLNGLFGAKLKNSLSMNIMFWSSSIGISTIGAVCASAPALWKTSSLNPIESARKIAWYEKTKTNLKYQIVIVLVLLGLIIYLFKFGTGIFNAFLLLGAILISATLILPIFLWFTLSLILKYKFKSPLMRWFFSDSKQQINSLSVSLMALLIALAINVGVGGMVESFRKTFNGWLDQRLVSELYIRTSDINASQTLKTVLDGEVDAILPIVRVSQNISGLPANIYGFEPHQTYEDHWPLIKKRVNAWKEINQNSGLIINEQLSRRLKLGVSDIIEFESRIGKSIRLEILGIYSDYGNPKGQIMLPFELFNKHFPDEPQLRIAIRVSKNSVVRIENILNKKLAPDKIEITNQVDIKNLSTKIFEKTFEITTTLSILTLGIAGMALFTSITTLGENRNSQLAPLWSIGTERKTLALFEILRSLSLSTLTFIFAVPVGLLVVFILTNYVNLEAFGWKLPIFYFPMQWITLCVVTIFVTLFSTCLYSIKLATASPAELLKACQYDT